MKELFDLSGKIAAVTGAARGIGQAIAIALAEAGADVVLIQRDVNNPATLQEIQNRGRRAQVVCCEMTDMTQVRSAVTRAAEAFGRIDIFVNNAGIQRANPAADFSEADWDEVYAVNLKSVFLLCREAGRHMLVRGSGKIINVASLMSFIAPPQIPAYTATKGAVVQLTKSLASEWASYGIHVNAIAPGYILTDMTPGMKDNKEFARQIPAGRVGLPRDIAGSAVFLASRASDYIYGHTIVIDGGVLCV